MGRPPTVPDFLFLWVSDSSLKGIYCHWGVRAIKMVSYHLLNLLLEMNTTQPSSFPQVGSYYPSGKIISSLHKDLWVTSQDFKGCDRQRGVCLFSLEKVTTGSKDDKRLSQDWGASGDVRLSAIRSRKSRQTRKSWSPCPMPLLSKHYHPQGPFALRRKERLGVHTPMVCQSQKSNKGPHSQVCNRKRHTKKDLGIKASPDALSFQGPSSSGILTYLVG